MSRYRAMFDALGKRREGAFGAFLMLGDPDFQQSAKLLDELVEGGADMVEVGIPFSDPVADGPVIQAAAKRALAGGITVGDCFDLISGFRARHARVPLGILTYANLVFARGRESFCTDAARAGADSLLVADVPAREAQPWSDHARSAGLDLVLIAASNTPDSTLEAIARIGSGYSYCVTRAGITGTHADAGFDSDLVSRLTALGAAPPIFGFGISTPDHVRCAIEAGASGVICGSAIVDCAARRGPVRELVRRLKSATRNDSPPQ